MEQREKLNTFAEKAGWTIVGQRKETIEAACQDIGTLVFMKLKFNCIEKGKFPGIVSHWLTIGPNAFTLDINNYSTSHCNTLSK